MGSLEGGGTPTGLSLDGKLDLEKVARVRAAFSRSGHAMLLADDQRRWVTANMAACELLGLAQETVPWHTMDDFTPLSERSTLEKQWAQFLSGGEAEGRYQLYVPDRDPFPVEFGGIAHVFPARHLALFIRPDEEDIWAGEAVWRALSSVDRGRLPLTKREREVMALVAGGGQSVDIARRLFVSPTTVKSHMKNAMGKLRAHTRAHAVAIALVTGQIAWSDEAGQAP